MNNININEIVLRNIYLRDFALGKYQGPMTNIPSFDKVWLKDYDEKSLSEYDDVNKSIYQFINDANKNRLDEIALDLRTSKNGYKKGICITYGEFFKRIKETAYAFHNMGVKANEIVPLIMPNVPESRIMIYALNYIGAIPYPINPTIPSKQLNDIINENNVKHTAVFKLFEDKFNEPLNNEKIENIIELNGTESLPKIFQKLYNFKNKKLNKQNSKYIEWNEFIKLASKCNIVLEPYYKEGHIAAIVGTSGTTGTPKGTCISDKSFNCIALQHKMAGILHIGDTNMDALIQSIAYGFSTMHFSGYCGFRNILIPELLTDGFPKALVTIKPDHFNGGPIHYNILANSKEFKEHIIPKNANLVSGGATLPAETEMKLNSISSPNEEVDESKVIVRQGSGATENGGCGTYAKEGAYKLGSVGIPLPLDTYGIFKPNTTEELPYNTEGEICVTGPTIMKKYLNRELETAHVLKTHDDGIVWLHLGDLGYMDETGKIVITDRIKDIFMRKGFNIHPYKISECLNELSLVEECKVVGVNHPLEQCVPVAFVRVSDEYLQKYSKQEIINMLNKQCYDNLDEFFVPYEYVFVNEFPRNLGGKIDSKKLIEDNNISYENNKQDKTKKYQKERH